MNNLYKMWYINEFMRKTNMFNTTRSVDKKKEGFSEPKTQSTTGSALWSADSDSVT